MYASGALAGRFKDALRALRGALYGRFRGACWDADIGRVFVSCLPPQAAGACPHSPSIALHFVAALKQCVEKQLLYFYTAPFLLRRQTTIGWRMMGNHWVCIQSFLGSNAGQPFWWGLSMKNILKPPDCCGEDLGV